jgi:hypothetical protein
MLRAKRGNAATQVDKSATYSFLSIKAFSSSFKRFTSTPLCKFLNNLTVLNFLKGFLMEVREKS